ncbi:5-bromo-4-chloroindolyl phosphate hydrolysis family protein [Mangrovicoccus algicola]|uniref:5-bromo-4-chloroindolyl phosphate hydrolysis family protein n=1 Tax=Mangrovicoccus algicola TaxID=2771008 RepID=A0A8J6Z7G5_9RHOB|nr:5-bromo-4-chloroindolyl phosphate hydrolysis family protein [Mangrovicoccus algicola]MBE3639384.1 5-bromo-4-chloroindolyl phosphate hydrolysis family protein [Mangrovicoccus algicola]
MARRYAGSYSPDPAAQAAPRTHPWQGKVPTRLGARVNILFVLPFLFAISAFFKPPLGMAAGLGAFGAMMLAAWLTREGIRAQAAYDTRSVARRPAIPRKIFGAAAMGIGLGLDAAWQGGLLVGTLLGGIGAGLHLLAFGPDPLRSKGIAGDDFQSGRVARAVEGAEAELAAMNRVLDPLRDRELALVLARFQATAREMFRTVEQDPRDLTAARRYLGVYLSGAREAAEKYAAYAARSRDPQARTAFVTLIDDLDRNFSKKTETLLLDDRSQLDIEMEVLRERLSREPHLSPSRTEG